MVEVFIKSILITLIAVAIMYFARGSFSSSAFISDTGWLFGSLVSAVGTLYGIMAAFIVFEVWSKYNKTSELIDQEALGLEQLSHLTLHFRDSKLSLKMNQAIKDYTQLVVESKLKSLVGGKREDRTENSFYKIGEIIRNIKFDDDHDSIVFDHVLSEYRNLSQVRIQRLNQNVTHLPPLLKVFLYVGSVILIGAFIAVPFNNIFYSVIAIGSIGFIVSMIIQLVEDLDDPTGGHWSLTSEPFKKVLKQISV